MKGDPEQRALLLGEYIVEHGATVRAAARAFGCSKSTVHKDVSVQAPPLCHVIWWNCSSAAFSSRLTCAWLMPISRATSIWVLPLR